jgi:hypothetical protein
MLTIPGPSLLLMLTITGPFFRCSPAPALPSSDAHHPPSPIIRWQGRAVSAPCIRIRPLPGWVTWVAAPSRCTTREWCGPLDPKSRWRGRSKPTMAADVRAAPLRPSSLCRTRCLCSRHCRLCRRCCLCRRSGLLSVLSPSLPRTPASDTPVDPLTIAAWTAAPHRPRVDGLPCVGRRISAVPARLHPRRGLLQLASTHDGTAPRLTPHGTPPSHPTGPHPDGTAPRLTPHGTPPSHPTGGTPP